MNLLPALKNSLFFFLLIVMLMAVAGQAHAADMLGIDVSSWQGDIDWEQVNGQVSFAMIKAGGGDNGTYIDNHFERNRDEVRRLGIPHGFYYYAGGGNPIEEAESFAAMVGPLEPGEVVALDFEADHSNPVGYSLQFMTRTEELLGVKPLLYTYMRNIWSYDWQPVAEHGNPLWGAIHDDEPQSTPVTGAWPNLTVKQYSSSGSLAGVGTSVDMNYFGASADDFRELGYSETEPSYFDEAPIEAPHRTPPGVTSYPDEENGQPAAGETAEYGPDAPQPEAADGGATDPDVKGLITSVLCPISNLLPADDMAKNVLEVKIKSQAHQ